MGKRIKYKKAKRTEEEPLGRVGELEWVTVTPDGAGIGKPADSEDMIPEGAELSDEERRAIEARRGARYFNNAMERGSAPFVGAANLLGWTFAPQAMAFASGATGLYNTFSGADGIMDNANAVWSDPNSSPGDIAKATYTAVLKPALDVAMVAGPTVKVVSNISKPYTLSRAIEVNPEALEAQARTAESGVQHGAQTTKNASQAIYPYEATKVIKEGPEVKVWRNGQGWNPAVHYRLEGKPSFFERVSDNEPGYYSPHFKTQDAFHNIDGRQMVSPDEKKMLFDVFATDFPEGGILSSHGSITPGGVHARGRLKTEYGWKQVGERIVHDTKGNEITIPILQKPTKPNVPFIRERETYVKHPNAYRAENRYKVQREIGTEPVEPTEEYFQYNFLKDQDRLQQNNGLTVGILGPEDFDQTPYSGKNFISDNIKARYNPKGDLRKQHEQLEDLVEYVGEYNPASLRLYDQYANAMGRRRSHRSLSFPGRVENGWFGVKNGQSAVFGFFDDVKNPATNRVSTVFKPSHFAPATMREGLDMIKKLGESNIPTVFAVTDDLSPMLYKSGQFARLTQMPQPFGKGIVMKDVMVNKAVQPWMVKEALRKQHIYDLSKEELQQLFDQLQFKTPETKITPTSTRLIDLLDEETIQKLKNIK